MSRVIGIDVSTRKVACVLLDYPDWQVVEFVSKAKDWQGRLDELQEQFWIFLRDIVTQDDRIFIEDIPYVQNAQALIRLVHVVAMCRTIATFFNCDFRYVNNLTWKQRVVGSGRASKQDIADKAQILYGEERTKHLSQDSLDALLIATYGQITINYEKWKTYDSMREHYKGVLDGRLQVN